MATLINRHRVTRLTGFASAQLVVQLLAFAGGLVVVRHMELAQYGYFTLALSLAGVATTLGDLGLATAVMAQGGPLARQPLALGQLLADAGRQHVRMAALASAVLLPFALALLLRQHAPLWQALALALLVAMVAVLNVRAGLALSVARLLGHVGLQQKLELGLGCAKLAALLLASWLMLDATVASAVNVAAAAAAVWVLRGHMARHAPAPERAAGLHLPALRRQVWQQAPNAIYYVLSSQIAVWLIGIFGSAERVAEVGALGRLGALFSLIGAVSATLVLPYFARRESGAELSSGLVAINGFFALLLASLLALAWTVPEVLLWVLGAHYAGLHNELCWMLTASTLAAWGGTLYSIGCARGWVMPFWLVAGSGVLATAGAALSVDVSTVRGSYLINTVTALTATVVALVYLVLQLRRHARSTAPLTSSRP